jgi:hypothetical protein
MYHDSKSRIVSPDDAEPSEVPINLTALKIEEASSPQSVAQKLDSGEHRRPRDSSDDVSELQGGAAACYHARGLQLEMSIQSASCDCEGTMTRARKRRLSNSPICDWQLVHASASHNLEPGSPANRSPASSLGIVLPAAYFRFAQNLGADFGIDQACGSNRSVVVVGLLLTGRIVISRTAFLQKCATTMDFDAVAFSEMISRACSECHSCSDEDDSGAETVARKFISKMRVGGALSCTTFESIFDRICTVCFSHHVEEVDRTTFLGALHCICSFKSFQTRFVTRRGQLALISLLQSCQSCLSAHLALNCINAISENKTIVSKLICHELIEALFSLVETHNSAASKVCAVLERW